MPKLISERETNTDCALRFSYLFRLTEHEDLHYVLVAPQMYQDPNMNSSMSHVPASCWRSSHGRTSGFPSIVCFMSQRLNGSTSCPPKPGGSLASMMTRRPPGRN